MIEKLFLLCLCLIGIAAKFPDWLISDFTTKTTLTKTADGGLNLSNGLISRKFTTYPDFTTIEYYQHEKQASILRALSPEAIIGIDGSVYNVGFLSTSVPRAYMNRTALKNDLNYVQGAFHFAGYELKKPSVSFPYKPMRGAPKDIVWPPKGVRLDVYFQAPESAPEKHKGITVCIHYEMYDGMPLMSKWVSITAQPSLWGKIKVSVYSAEVLAVNQQWSQVSFWDGPNTYKWMYVNTNQAHGTRVNWINDPMVDLMPGSFEPMLNVSYDVNNNIPTPVVNIDQDGFESFHVHEIAHGASDETRRALARNRLIRLLAPHTQESPIFFHLSKADNETFHKVVDQLAEVGFEMLIYSFGSGFQMESDDEKYIDGIRQQVQYAKSKGIEVGGYDLIVLDRGPGIDFKYRALKAGNVSTGNACMASEWYDYIHDKVFSFLNKTGMTMVETDGPYGGGSCTSEDHPHHEGYSDSVFKQQKLQGQFYNELRKMNVFINQPDYFFYEGGNKVGYGYNEDQYSLPRDQDLSVSRQGLFDRFYFLPPPAGWMFLPLVDYHGGGDAAMFEPLNQHLKAYNFGLAQYLSSGTAACYRGYRIFDTDETKAVVKKWVSFFKKYRDILTSDVVRVRRADMQSMDAFMHVNYKLNVKGLLMVFNPTLEIQEMILTVPLYYTGIKHTAAVSEQDGATNVYPLDMGWEIEIPVSLQPQEVSWFTIRDSDKM